MSLLTKYFGFIKPTLSERYSILTLNSNMDKIDEEIHNLTQRTEMSSPYTGEDAGNRLPEIIGERQTENSIVSFLTTKLVEEKMEQIQFIAANSIEGLPEQSEYDWLIETYGLKDGASESNTILIYAKELGGDRRIFISHYDKELSALSNPSGEELLDQPDEAWEMIYPMEDYEDLKVGKRPVFLNEIYFNENEETNSFEKVVTKMVSGDRFHVSAIYVVTENISETEEEQIEYVQYILDVNAFWRDPHTGIRHYQVIRRKMKYPYTIDFNEFDGDSYTFSLESWKIIYPIDAGGSLPENIITEEKDPVFTENLGITVCHYIQDVWDEAGGSFLNRMMKQIETSDHFKVILHQEDDTNWLVSVDKVIDNSLLTHTREDVIAESQVIALYSIYRNEIGGKNRIEFNEYGIYQEFEEMTNEIVTMKRYVHADYIQLYPFPESTLTENMKETIAEIYDPLYRKVIGYDTGNKVGEYHPISELLINHDFSTIAGIDSENGQFGSDEVIEKSMRNHIDAFQEQYGEPNAWIVEIGYNDFVNQISVGKAADSFDETTYDETTFSGGLEAYIHKATQTWENAEIILFASIPNNKTVPVEEGKEPISSSEYLNAAMDIADKWGITIVMADSILNLSSHRNDKYLNSEGNLLSEAGYKSIMKYIDKSLIPLI